MLYQLCVSNLTNVVGSTPHGSFSSHLSWNASLANGLHGDGLPCLYWHRLFGHLMSSYCSPFHLLASSPFPVQCGALLGCMLVLGSWYALSWKWNASIMEFHPSSMLTLCMM